MPLGRSQPQPSPLLPILGIAAVCLTALLAFGLPDGKSKLVIRTGQQVALKRASKRPIEIPIVNIPRGLREWNWGGGSCVHASTVMVLRWANNLDLAAWWRKTYSGGESYNGLTNKLTKNHVPWYSSYSNRTGPPNDVAFEGREFIAYLKSQKVPMYYTTDGDASVLDRCIRERRGAVIFYKPGHSIMLVHMDAKQAIVLDNNAIEQFESIPRETFIRNWQNKYGGVAVVPTIGSPAPPLPWIAKN